MRKYCLRCGGLTESDEQVKFCQHCGTPFQQEPDADKQDDKAKPATVIYKSAETENHKKRVVIKQAGNISILKTGQCSCSPAA